MNSKRPNKRKISDLPFESEMQNQENKMTKISEDSVTFLSASKYQAKECGGEGNCLFLSISFLLGNKKGTSHTSIRKKACDYIEKKLCDFEGSLEYSSNPQEYLKKMRKSGVWGGHPEIKALATIVKRNIQIFESKFSSSGRHTGFQFKAQENVSKPTGAPLLLHHIPETHYQAIILYEKIEIKLDKRSSEKNSKQSSQDISRNLSNSPQFDPSIIVKREKEQRYPKRSQVCDLYNDVLQYFKSEKVDLPQTLNGKGEAFWRKRYKWKAVCEKNYMYDRGLDRIMQKEEVSYHYLPKTSSNNVLKNKKKNDQLYYCWFYIPLEKEKKLIMDHAHNNFCHNGRDRMLINIRRMGYTWFNLTKEVKLFINECSVCKFKNLKKSQNPPTTTQIIATHPGNIYQIDMVNLAQDYQTEEDKYLVVIADHFSKFGWCKSYPSKESKFVVEAIRVFFTFCGKPNILQSDNGKEFVNKEVESFLQKQGVKFVHGRPYHPQSQGMVERLNRTIQENLNVVYAKDPTTFNIRDAVNDIMRSYNSNYHTSIKMTPREAFNLDINDEND